jgi:hypothetical protein
MKLQMARNAAKLKCGEAQDFLGFLNHQHPTPPKAEKAITDLSECHGAADSMTGTQTTSYEHISWRD